MKFPILSLFLVTPATFNAVKYLINEKPFASLLIIYLLTILELPLALFIIERYEAGYI